jgi:hypothetical protein
MLEQRTDETKEAFAQRRLKHAERNNERAMRLHEFATEPKDLYADAVTFHEDRGILRIAFHCSRPDSEDAIGAPSLPVARVSFHFKMFKYYFETWLKSQAGLDALSE